MKPILSPRCGARFWLISYFNTKEAGCLSGFWTFCPRGLWEIYFYQECRLCFSGRQKQRLKTRYIDPDLIGARAQEIAEALAEGGLKPSGFNPILRELKKVNKKNLPVEVKKGALAGAIIKAKLLVQKKRAPRLLVALLEQNLEAVQGTTDYGSAYQHLEAVGVYLTEYQK